MADNMEEELKKLKVPELKQALKDKGLSTSGTKPDLIKRLAESVGSAGDSNDPVIDEDEILKDDSTPTAAAAPPKPAPSIVAKSDVASNGVAATNPEPKQNVQMAADTTVRAKPTEVKEMTDAERLKLRADKFGVTSEKTKKDLRAQRFGMDSSENKSGNISSSTGPVDVDKLKKRAERFGVSTSSVTEDERKRKRAERFNTSATTSASTKSISLNSTDSELEAKKRKRAERFGLT